MLNSSLIYWKLRARIFAVWKKRATSFYSIYHCIRTYKAGVLCRHFFYWRSSPTWWSLWSLETDWHFVGCGAFLMFTYHLGTYSNFTVRSYFTYSIWFVLFFHIFLLIFIIHLRTLYVLLFNCVGVWSVCATSVSSVWFVCALCTSESCYFSRPWTFSHSMLETFFRFAV